jgi:hypothetical protein
MYEIDAIVAKNELVKLGYEVAISAFKDFLIVKDPIHCGGKIIGYNAVVLTDWGQVTRFIDARS